MKIVVPGMYPFPQIVFDADQETLTAIAALLMVIHMNESTKPLCWQLMGLDESADGMPSDVFTNAMADALGDCEFATTWVEQHHGLDLERAASLRPSWAAHIADHINKELSK